MDRIERQGLSVDRRLVEFIEASALPGSGVAAERFWAGLSAGIADLGPMNRDLLAVRARPNRPRAAPT